MHIISKRPAVGLLLAMTAMPLSVSVFAQQPNAPEANSSIIVNGVPMPDPSTMVAGPEIKGVIAARNGDRIKVKAADGSSTIVALTDITKIKAGSGLFSSNRAKLDKTSLLNGLPVTVKTLQPAAGQTGGLFASQITFRNNDLKTANMIRNGTDQRFEEQTAATEALRGRMADIDKYNVKNTTNVHFDTGKAVLSAEDKAQLCATATEAGATENALMLVVGYTDSVGGEDFNQTLSEKRAARVINYLQQACGWKPYRMLTPTGMAEADPLADNTTEEGKAQNRRVAVNILVSKSVDGM
jgi:outer membrane protein OmpA-like peptidoglycan-associated protein